MPTSPLVHRTVTALAVTLGVGALAASASGMRAVDGDLAAAVQLPAPTADRSAPATTPGHSSVRDGEVVAPVCRDESEPRGTAAPAPDPAPATRSREL